MSKIDLAHLKKLRDAKIMQQAEENTRTEAALVEGVAKDIARRIRYCANAITSHYVYNDGKINYNDWSCQGTVRATLSLVALKNLREKFPNVSLVTEKDDIKIKVNKVDLNMLEMERKRAEVVERERLRSVALREKLERNVVGREKQCREALERYFIDTGSFSGYKSWECEKTKVGTLRDDDLKLLKSKFPPTVTFETGRYNFYGGGYDEVHEGVRFTIHPSHFGVDVKK